jgi:hypothetical protein
MPLTTLIVIAIASASCPHRSGREDFLLGGIQVNEADHERWFDALESAGMNTVAATVYAMQGDWDTDHLWWEDEEDAVLMEIRGAKARGLKVVLIPRVALDHAFPRNRFLWHGLIMPRSDEAIDAWFGKYEAFLVKWAEVAEQEGVDVLAVGSEMNALASTRPLEDLPALEEYYLDTEKQTARTETYLKLAGDVGDESLRPRGGERFESLEGYLDAESAALSAWAGQTAFELDASALDRMNERRARLERLWEHAIEAVRGAYHGPLTYAANFDQYRDVGFWPALDLIGINAYFPLRTLDDPVADEAGLYDALVRGWRRIFAEIDAFEREAGIPDTPVLLTEIGYTRKADVTLAPWAGTGMTLVEGETGKERLVVWSRQPDEPRERALAMRALHEVAAASASPRLRGLLYWKLSTEPAHREVEPFVYILGASDDPLGDELRRFREP